MVEPIVFFDIPSFTKGKAWSPNTWKVRYVRDLELIVIETDAVLRRFCLNIKNIPYKTVWVEFPDIENLCKKIGAEATGRKPDGRAHYTLPAIYDPNTKTAVSNSIKIARYLDKTYPDTRVVLPVEGDAFIAMFEEKLWSVFPTFAPFNIIVPPLYDIIRPASKPYFRSTREERLGPFEELAPIGSAKRAEKWEETKQGMHKIAAWLEAGPDPSGEEKLFFMGNKIGITYAVIRLASILLWFKACLGEESQEWKKMMDWDGGRWARLLAAFEKWEVVDDGEEGEQWMASLIAGDHSSR